MREQQVKQKLTYYYGHIIRKTNCLDRRTLLKDAHQDTNKGSSKNTLERR